MGTLVCVVVAHLVAEVLTAVEDLTPLVQDFVPNEDRERLRVMMNDESLTPPPFNLVLPLIPNLPILDLDGNCLSDSEK